LMIPQPEKQSWLRLKHRAGQGQGQGQGVMSRAGMGGQDLERGRPGVGAVSVHGGYIPRARPYRIPTWQSSIGGALARLVVW
jgi:hypothetical protein